MKNLPMPRLDECRELNDHLLRYCRIKEGQVWDDPTGGHKVGCLDATNLAHVERLMGGEKAKLAVHDPPYNSIAFKRASLIDFIHWCEKWVENTDFALTRNSSLYIWLGADAWRRSG